MQASIQRVKPPLEVRPIEGKSALESEHCPVIASRCEGLESAALGADVPGGRRRAAAPALRSVPLAHHSRDWLPKHDRASEEARSDRCPAPSRARSRYRSPRPGVLTQAVKEVPQPQLDFALGLTKVKPPVKPCVT